MKHRKLRKIAYCFLPLLVSLSACQQVEPKKTECHILIEDANGVTIHNNYHTVERGEDTVFHFSVLDGYLIESINYPNYTLSKNGTNWALTLFNVKYSSVITLSITHTETYCTYHSEEESQIVYYQKKHLRMNTSLGTMFQKEGHTLIGWRTPNGEQVGLGSRTDETTDLYADWAKWTDTSHFSFDDTIDGKNVVITGYFGTETTVCVPMEYQGKRVIGIEQNAFQDIDLDTLVLSPSVLTIADGAFTNTSIQTLYLYDSLLKISDNSFSHSPKQLHVNAVESPVYSGTYFDTFQDKYDRLLSLKDEKKIVLWSGSSTRFGYDSEAIDRAFPAYNVVNMGVFAYSVTTPEFQLILDCMNEGDILLHSPEFDATERQFAYIQALDKPFWCMMESNYDAIRSLNMQNYENVFDSFQKYLLEKMTMEKKSYALSPTDYDEDGVPVSSPSYNEYGDYIVYRPNAEDVKPIYGLPVPYTVKALERYIPSLNRQYEAFLEKGVNVYYTFSPRNKYAISKESSPKVREELEAYLKENLIVPIITSLESSLWEGTYLFGTDNHLSTEGVRIRTEQVIEALKKTIG